MSTVQKSLVLSVRDLERKRAEAAAPAGTSVTMLSAERLRDVGPMGALRVLRRERYDTVTVAGSSEELHDYSPALAAASLFVRAKRRRWVDLTTGAEGTLDRGPIIKNATRMLRGTLVGLGALVRKRREIQTLLSRNVHVAWNGDASKVLYLKGGPFSGVKVGGSVGHVAGVANALARLGSSVRMLAVGRQMEVSDEVQQQAVPPRTPWGLPVAINALSYSYRFLGASERLALEWRPGFSYQRFSPQDLTGAHLRLMGVPWVLEFNGSEVWVEKNWGRPGFFSRVARSVEVAALTLADLVVVVSAPLEQEVRALGVPPERILCYPNCIDPERFDPTRFSDAELSATRAEFNIAEGDTLLTFIGTFGQWHGTDVLAEAIRDLVDSARQWLREHKVRFLLVGSGLRLRYVQELLSQAGDEEFVRFAGVQPQDRAPAILAASDILLSPHKPNDDGSAFFGSPTKLFEYMAMSRLIVASDLDQIGDVARGWVPHTPPPPRDQDSDLMVLVQPGSVEDLVRGIRHACRMSPTERATYGDRCRDAALEHYTWDANAACVVRRLAAVTLPTPAPSSLASLVEH